MFDALVKRANIDINLYTYYSLYLWMIIIMTFIVN